MREKNNTDKDKAQITKQKLLDSAVEVFSEKGFDGARVDEIAARAKVNKAMLYYYFDSKEKLFEELVRQYKDEVKVLKASLINNIDITNEDNIETVFQGMYDFMESKKEILRIIMIESLKANSQDVTIFSSLLPSIEIQTSKVKNKGFEVVDTVELMINSFYFTMLPSAVYLVLGDRWADFYGFDKEEAKKKFMKRFKDIRSEYFKANLK